MVIATMHGKEGVIKPILDGEIGVNCFVPEYIDTDQFGTFSGEIKRSEDPLATARNKCLHAMKISNCDLGIASEGSFGPHPSSIFLPANEEILLVIDAKNKLEIVVRNLSVDTNLKGEQLSSLSQLIAFIHQVGFPEHAINIRKSAELYDDSHKGIKSMEQLTSIFTEVCYNHGSAYVETDMRAMHNPTRMKHIEKTTFKLVGLLKATCPNCAVPGFGVVSVERGLPCSMCNEPTDSILSHTESCLSCKHTEKTMYPLGKRFEDPGSCNWCNP